MVDFVGGVGGLSYLLMRVELVSQSVANNTSTVSAQLYLIRSSGTGRYSNYTNNSWAQYVDGQGQGGSGTYDLRGGGTMLLLSGTFTVGHAADGTKYIGVAASFSDPRGNTSPGAINSGMSLPTIPRAPGAPAITSAFSITPSGFSLQLAAPSNVGGSAITNYETQVSTSSTFASGITTVNSGTTLAAVFNGLIPSSTYYARTRATNGQGTSPWSTSFTVVTAGAGAPHLGVLPRMNRQGFQLVATPPFSVSAGTITKYVATRVVTGPNAPADANFDVPNTGFYTDPIVLLAGQAVTYRVAAVIAATQTAYSSSVSLSYVARTPAPPIFPIFEGSTGAQPAPYALQVSSWEGAVENSRTLLKGRHPKGWRKFSEGAGESGAVGVVTQISDVLTTFSSTSGLEVAALLASVQTAAGLRVGTAVGPVADMAEVYPTVTYFASIIGAANRSTRLAAEIEWYSSSGVLLGRSQGDAVATSTTGAVNLLASGIAPVSAAYAAVVTVDVAGTGHSLTVTSRYAGSAMLSSSAPYPYFDGDTLDDAVYSYEWRGDVDASSSLRISAAGGGNALVDPDQPVMPSPPRPPQVEESVITDDIVWRRYIAAVDALDVREWIAAVPTLSLYTMVEEARQVRIRWWRNPQDLPADVWSSDGQTFELEQYISYIPKNATFVADGVAERAYVNFPASLNQEASTVAADHLFYGPDGGPAVWGELACNVGYVLTLDVPVEAAEGNLAISLNLTDRMF